MIKSGATNEEILKKIKTTSSVVNYYRRNSPDKANISEDIDPENPKAPIQNKNDTDPDNVKNSNIETLDLEKTPEESRNNSPDGEKEQQKIICANCETELKTNMVYCPNCGGFIKW